MFDSCLSEFDCRRRQGKIQRPAKPGAGFGADTGEFLEKGKIKPRAAVAGARQSLDRKALVRDIQGQLNRLGYPVGKPDNELLEALKRAKEQLLRSARCFS